MRRGPTLTLWCLCLVSARLAIAQKAPAQPATGVPKVTPSWAANVYRGGDELIELTLDRVLGPRESLAMMISNTDVSALVDVDGTRVRYRPSSSLWKKSESEIVVYLVRDTAWTELAKLPIKVRNRFGLDVAGAQPTAELSSAGQVKEGGNQPPSSRASFQDLTLRLGSATTMKRAPWQFETNANAVAVSNQEQRLRYGLKGKDAPPIDLSDYSMRLSRGNSAIAVGNMRRADHKQLLPNVTSRGVSGALQLGSFGMLDAAVMNGTNVVGFENLLGLERAEHRMSAAKLSMEFVPKKPGVLHVTLSGMDGSVLPRQNFNQASVTDAEQSTGWGSQVDVALPGDRMTLSAGLAQSRFRNPVDPLLSGDSTLVAVKPESRLARFGELRLQLLREYHVTDSLPVDVAVTARHERIDPLYRSVGGNMQADMQSNGGDVQGRVGLLTIAAQYAQARDNLANIASLLTSRTNTSGLNLAMPLTAVIGSASDWYLPALTYARQGTHQFGDGVPTNGEFSASDVPDQASTTNTMSVDWTKESNTLSYRLSTSNQDNRQPGYENIDIDGTVHTVTLGMMPTQSLQITLDVSREKQHMLDTDVQQGLNRIGTMARWQPNAATMLSANVTHSTTVPSAGESKRTNMEMRFEASRAFALLSPSKGTPSTRLFLRFSRTLQNTNPQFAGAIATRTLRWTLNAGGSVRIF